MSHFCEMKGVGGTLGMKDCASRSLQKFLSNITTRMIPIHGFSWLVLLNINWYVVVHLIHFSTPKLVYTQSKGDSFPLKEIYCSPEFT